VKYFTALVFPRIDDFAEESLDSRVGVVWAHAVERRSTVA
jgi:hypothetical protein